MSDTVAHAYNSSTRDVETRRALVPCQSDYIVKTVSKKKTIINMLKSTKNVNINKDEKRIKDLSKA